MQYSDTIKLGFGGSLILGNANDKLTLERIHEKTLKDSNLLEVESFGLFDSSQPNYSTYYPDVTVEDLNPKPEDFIEPVYRALSEVIVHKNWNPVDFSMNGVLKKSTNLLKGQTVNIDHETAVGNAIGSVSHVYWEESYKAGNIVIPAGINSKLKIDGKSNPRIARGILMDPPSIHSTSVTVQFKWAKSHAIAEEDFFAKLGTTDKDGKLYRRIAEKVDRYNEISLVGHGADPFAQLVKDAGIVNPNFANISYNSLTGGQKQKQRFFFFDLKSDIVNNSENSSIPENSNNNNSSQTELKMNKAFLIALAAVFGKTIADPENPTQEEYTEIQNAATTALTANNTNTQLLTANQAEITRLTAVETAYNNERAALAEAVALKAFKDEQTNAMRSRVLANLSLIHKGSPDASLSAMIAKANHETLAILDLQYAAQLEEKIPLTCKACGSHEINRATATQSEQSENSGTKDIRAYLKKRENNAANQIHGVIPTQK